MKKSSRRKARNSRSNRKPTTPRLEYDNLEARQLLAGLAGGTDMVQLEQPVPIASSIQLLRNHLDLGENEGVVLNRIIEDQVGNQHFRYHQTLNGVEVENGVYTVHTKDGNVVSLSGEYHEFDEVSAGTRMTSEAAFQKAKEFVGSDQYAWEVEGFAERAGFDGEPEGELVYLIERGEDPVLTYKFDMYSISPLSRSFVYVDVSSGEITKSLDRFRGADVAATGVALYDGPVEFTADSNNGEFRLQQAAQGIQTFEVNGGDQSTAVDITNPTTDFTGTDKLHKGVSAHVAAEATYQFFLDEFGLDSYDGAGTTLFSYVGFNFTNAFWTGTEMLYGDGGGAIGPLVTLDIGGHEIGHGVTEFSSNLIYQNESGALNESYSDIWGEVVEWYVTGANNWRLGDQIFDDGSGIRNMANPNEFNDPDTYLGDNWWTSPGDSGGVHTNSGVQNKYFFLLTDGETGVNDNGDNYDVTGIGIADAARILYHTNSVYLGPGSSYQDARDFGVQAAIDLFGAGSQQHVSTNQAWRAVGLYGPELEIFSFDRVSEATEIFRASVGDEVAVGEIDAVTVSLDPGQKISVTATGYDGLIPAFNIVNPAGAVIGTGTNFGNTTVFQNAPVDVAGTYTINVSGADGTAGGHLVEVVLNASVETESYGSSNGTMADAQNIDSSLIPLNASGAERLGAVGELSLSEAEVAASEDFEAGTLPAGWTTYSSHPQGRVLVTPDFGAANGSTTAILMDQRADGVNNLNEAIMPVDLTGLNAPVLSFWHAELNDETTVLPPIFANHRNGDGVSVSVDGTVWYTILTDTDTPTGEWSKFTIDLAEFADAKGFILGDSLQVKFQQYDDQRALDDGRLYDEIEISATSLVSDWYSFTLDANETATMATTKLNPGADVLFELYDSTGAMITTGVEFGGDEDVDIISRYTNAGESATFFAKITGADSEYSFVATRDADFETDSNDESNPQDIADLPVVLAHTSLSAVAVADPDEVNSQTVVNNYYDGVTLSDNVTGGSVYAAMATYPAPTGTNVFSPSPDSAAGFQNGVNEFRADFDILQAKVSVDIGSDDGANDVGFLRAYDSDGVILAERTTGSLPTGQSQKLEIDWFRPEIAYIIAGGLGNDVAPVDNLRYEVAADQTDFFSFDLVNYQSVKIDALLPGDGPLLFQNTLADGPGGVSIRMELVDPLGNTIATGEDSIDSIANTSGKFTLKVFAVSGAGDYVLEVKPGVVDPNSVVIEVGDLKKGIAVDDTALGQGYIMYSAQVVHDRFADNAPHPDNSDHLIAVRHIENVGWEYNNNTGWHAMEIALGDRLLATADFGADTVASLGGAVGQVRGINQGFAAGDLSFVANSWDGIALADSTNPSVPNGEFEAVGNFFSVDSEFDVHAVGGHGLGVAVHDDATGTGFIMFSQQNLHARFGGGVFTGNADHFIGVRHNGINWQMSDNYGWLDFTPVAGDRLMAEVDFDLDTAKALSGFAPESYMGVALGYVDGDISITPNVWNGTANDGEFGVNGSKFTTEDGVAVGTTGLGIAVHDDATGSGFMMYSQTRIGIRFGAAAFPGNADHFVAVRHDGMNWQFSNNLGWVNFTPEAGDRLMASVDFGADTVEELRGVVGEYRGIDMGFETSDVAITPNVWDGEANAGEFGITGSYFTTNSPSSVGNLRSGVAVDDAATGIGFMMYSASNVHDRFGTLNGVNSDHFVAVRFNGTSWQFNSNLAWVDFTPAEGDRLMASVDFDADTVTSMKGVDGSINGIDVGYDSGNLEFLPNRYGGSANSGEFEVAGSYFTIDELLTVTDTGSGYGGVAVADATSGIGYIMYSEQSIHDRFSTTFSLNSDHFIAVRYLGGGSWEYNDNHVWLAFNAEATDRLVAAADFTTDTVTTLAGTPGRDIGGISLGYSSGSLNYAADSWFGSFNDGEFEVFGDFFLS